MAHLDAVLGMAELDPEVEVAAYAFTLSYKAGVLFASAAACLGTLLLTLKVVKISLGGAGASAANVLSAAVISVSLCFVVMTIVHQLWQDDDFMCWFGFYSCAILYGASKFLVYLFMIEKQYVASARSGTPRLKSTAYRLNLALLLPFVALLVLMLLFGYGTRHFGDHGIGCHILLRPESALPLAFYDSFFTLGLTAQFARLTFKVAAKGPSAPPPSTAAASSGQRRRRSSVASITHAVRRGSMAGSDDGGAPTRENKLRAVGIKNLKGSVLSLLSTAANLVSVTIAPESGLPMAACYSFCNIDVLINCWVTFRMTSKGPLLSCRCPLGVKSGRDYASSNGQRYAGSVLSQDGGGRRNSIIRSNEGNHDSILSQDGDDKARYQPSRRGHASAKASRGSRGSSSSSLAAAAAAAAAAVAAEAKGVVKS